MQMVFSTELALVQGPPGTGKTYIERAIIELIHKHTNEVMGDDHECPLIVDATLADEGGLYGAMALLNQHV